MRKDGREMSVKYVSPVKDKCLLSLAKMTVGMPVVVKGLEHEFSCIQASDIACMQLLHGHHLTKSSMKQTVLIDTFSNEELDREPIPTIETRTMQMILISLEFVNLTGVLQDLRR
jgi:hypothetical protein